MTGSFNASYTLTGGVIAETDHTYLVQILLTDTDLNAIKFDTNLATVFPDSRVTFTANLVTDMNKNPVTPITMDNLISEYLYYQDRKEPELNTFDLDLNEGTLSLHFSETVNSETLDATQVTLLSRANASMNTTFTFSEETNTSSIDGTTLVLNISLDNLNEIKRISSLATSNDTTYLALTDNTVQDMNHNNIVPIYASDPTPVSIYTADSTEPELLSFSLDYTSETLTLSFSETVQFASVTTAAITISDNSITPVTLTGGTVLTPDDPVVIIQMIPYDLNRIKYIGIATEINDTFISITNALVMDMANNSVTEIVVFDALMADEVTQDAIPPELTNFDLDMNHGLITFYFSETIDEYSLIAQEVTLQSSKFGSEGTTYYNIAMDSVSPLFVKNYGLEIVFSLDIYDIYNIQELVTLATGPNDTFISITTGFITDTFNNSIVAHNNAMALKVQMYSSDGKCPSLDSFMLDLNEGLIHITFNEPVNTSTFDETEVTVYSEANVYSIGHTLTFTTYEGDTYSRFMTVRLSNFDQDTIKYMTSLGVSESSTNLYLSMNSVQDTADNWYCNDTTPIPAYNVTEDITSPRLLNFTIDLNKGTLYLTFSESIQHDTIEYDQISLIFNTNNDSIIYYNLTTGTAMVNNTISPHIVIVQLTDEDTNEIKYDTELATDDSNTYLAITEDAVVDYNDNLIEPIEEDNPLPVNQYIADTSSPSIKGFNLDMNQGTLLIEFNEVVNLTSIETTGLVIQSSTVRINGEYHTIQNARAEFQTLTEVLLYISSDDLNAIKKITTLATNNTNTYITVDATFVRNNDDLDVVPIGPDAGVLVSVYFDDETTPKLEKFSLNLTSEILSLTFDETVNAKSVVITGITIQSGKTNATEEVAITDGEILNEEDSTIVSIKLTDTDLHEIKRRLDLATDENNTCITIDDSSVSDLAQSPNTVLETTLCNVSLTEDRVQPNLINFLININTSTLILNFDEPINMDSVDLTEITFQSVRNISAVDSYEYYTLTGGNVTSPDQLMLTVTITNDDLNEIKKMFTLLRGTTASYITFAEAFATDVNDNSIVSITTDDAKQAAVFVSDSTRPTLLRFDLDMDNGQLTLYFYETVDISKFDVTQIALQQESFTTNPEHRQVLTNTGMLINQENDPTLVYVISNDDLNLLKTKMIARTSTSTYLIMSNATITDIVGEAVIPHETGINAAFVTDFTPDSNSPLLQSFNLDLDNGQLILFFNETVNSLSFDASSITLTAAHNETSDALSYTLSSDSDTNSNNDPKLTVALDNDDLNEIKKRPGLATSENNTYLFMTSNTVMDMYDNKNVQLSPTQAISVSTFTEDKVRPQFLSFKLDMNNGLLTMSFDETVNTTSLNTGAITLHDESISEQYVVSGKYVSVNNFSAAVEVVLINNDLNEIKVRSNMATGEDNTYISITDDFIKDMNGNLVISVDGYQIETPGFTPDVTPPSLLNFTIDMDLGQMILDFDESINASSTLFDYLALRANETVPSIPSNIDRQHQLTDGKVLTLNGPSLTLQILDDDFNEIKRKDVCTIDLQEEDCYLAYRTSGITDMAGNPIQGCREL